MLTRINAAIGILGLIQGIAISLDSEINRRACERLQEWINAKPWPDDAKQSETIAAKGGAPVRRRYDEEADRADIRAFHTPAAIEQRTAEAFVSALRMVERIASGEVGFGRPFTRDERRALVEQLEMRLGISTVK
jgi:hypothetical protein